MKRTVNICTILLVCSMVTLEAIGQIVTDGSSRTAPRDDNSPVGYDAFVPSTNVNMATDQILLRNSVNGAIWLTFFDESTGGQHYSTNDVSGYTGTNGPTTPPYGPFSTVTDIMPTLTNQHLTTSDAVGTPAQWSVDVIGDVAGGDDKAEAVITRVVDGFLYKATLFFADNGTVSSASASWRNRERWVIEGAGRFVTNNTVLAAANCSTNAAQLLLRNNENGYFWLTFLNNDGFQVYETNNITGNIGSTGYSVWPYGPFSDNAPLLAKVPAATNSYSLSATDYADLNSVVNWTVSAIGDVNGDGQDEVIVENDVGDFKYKCTLFFEGSETGVVNTASTIWRNRTRWQLQACGQFVTNETVFSTWNNGSESEQLLLRNNENGALWLTFFTDNGTQWWTTNDVSGYGITGYGPFSALTNVFNGTNAPINEWTVQAVVDVNNDGRSDVVMARTGESGLANETFLQKKVIFFDDNGTVIDSSPQWRNKGKWSIMGSGTVSTDNGD